MISFLKAMLIGLNKIKFALTSLSKIKFVGLRFYNGVTCFCSGAGDIFKEKYFCLENNLIKFTLGVGSFIVCAGKIVKKIKGYKKKDNNDEEDEE